MNTIDTDQPKSTLESKFQRYEFPKKKEVQDELTHQPELPLAPK